VIQEKKSAALTTKKKREALQADLPNKITVLGRAFEVVITNLKGLHGDCNLDKNVIRIHQNCTPEQARVTLFHEAVHAALAVSGHNEMLKENQEEALVRMMEHAFNSCIDINKLT
jgi:Zn-dependent peptidase ImmA (M78 family)